MNPDKLPPLLETSANGFLNYKLIDTTKFSLTIWDAVVIAAIIIITIFGLKLIKKAIIRNKRIDSGKQYSLYNLTKYIVVVIATIWILQTIGVKFTLLIGGSAALLVGVGLGLQNLFSDFVSGIILLVDSSIKVGDVIEVNGLVCEVKKINLRTTQVITRDDKFILLPNSLLTKNSIINWTINLDSSRFDVSVGVDYSSDIDVVSKILIDACNEEPEIESAPSPFVHLKEFEDSSLKFTVYFWAKNMFRVENIKSNVRKRIFAKFAEQGVSIPFPQRVLQYRDEKSEQKDNQFNN